MADENKDDGYTLATPGDRFLAALADGFLAGLVTLLPLYYFALADFPKMSDGSLPASFLLGTHIFSFLFFLIMHGYLLKKYGQTIGKNIVGIKIVTVANQLPDFKYLILLRYLPLWTAVFIPIIGGLFPTVDILFIFRKDRRCIHDLIAGTMVVDIGANDPPPL
ncbi:MAG: RDD family protein [Gammaproteobacteria bacterium]|nr:RDD family protein [Gammaproteobacteria bacterium]